MKNKRKCACGCGLYVKGGNKYATKTCIKASSPAASLSNVKCKCGCGRFLRLEQVKMGIKFFSTIHANLYNAKLNKGKKYKPRKDKLKEDTEYYQHMTDGRMYCANYDKDSLSCVMCLEQALFTAKSCYNKGAKDELRKVRKEN